MPNELIVYNEGKNIAYLTRELASRLERTYKEIRKLSYVHRVSDTYVGRYGVLGFVEMSLVGGPELPLIGGIIEIPSILPDRMKNIPGMTGYISELLFQDTNFFNDDKNKESLSHPSLEGIALLDKEYFWFPVQPHVNSEKVSLNELVKDVEKIVIEFLTNFDKTLDRFVPEDKRPTYSTLQKGLLEKLEQ